MQDRDLYVKVEIDHYQRYQSGLTLEVLYPSIKGKCACGCGELLTGRQTRWASRDCNTRAYEGFAIVKGDQKAIRSALFAIDEGYCRNCGVYDKNWEADHIFPVHQGGGASDINNFQTLCPVCHKEKTNFQREFQRSDIS